METTIIGADRIFLCRFFSRMMFLRWKIRFFLIRFDSFFTLPVVSISMAFGLLCVFSSSMVSISKPPFDGDGSRSLLIINGVVFLGFYFRVSLSFFSNLALAFLSASIALRCRSFAFLLLFFLAIVCWSII